MLVKDFTRKKRKGGKLDPKWLGPYVIQKKVSRGVYAVALHNNLSKTRKVTGAHLKLYKKPSKFDRPTKSLFFYIFYFSDSER